MAIDVHGGGHLAVAHLSLDHSRVLSLHDHQRCAGMAEIVEADARQTGGFGQAVKHVSERYHCQGVAIKGMLSDEYKPFVYVVRCCQNTSGLLRLPGIHCIAADCRQ